MFVKLNYEVGYKFKNSIGKFNCHCLYFFLGKLELKKEVIASLTNDAMANVWGGDLVKNTIGCISPSQGGGCGSGNCIPYTQDPNKCPLTEFNTCDCVVPNTKICVKLTYHCVLDNDVLYH